MEKISACRYMAAEKKNIVSRKDITYVIKKVFMGICNFYGAAY